MGHMHAPGHSFKNGSKHYKGPIRFIIEFIGMHASKEHSSYAVWRYYYRNQSPARLDLVREADMVIAGATIIYKRVYNMKGLPAGYVPKSICEECSKKDH